MTVQELIRLLENKLVELNRARASLFNVGDVGAVFNLDAEIEKTAATLNQLKALG